MRHKSKITEKGHNKGRIPVTKGTRLYTDTLTPDEVLALVDACNCGASGLRDRCLIVFLYRTGLRISEALGLRVHDIDLERKTVRVRGTKTRTSDRIVGLDDMAAAHLIDWLDIRHRKVGQPKTQGYVFCCISKHERGRPVKSPQVRQKLYMLREKAGISKRVHPHGLRHSFASEMADEGADLRVIQNALGHSNVAVTSLYISHLNPKAVIDYMSNRRAA